MRMRNPARLRKTERYGATDAHKKYRELIFRAD